MAIGTNSWSDRGWWNLELLREMYNWQVFFLKLLNGQWADILSLRLAQSIFSSFRCTWLQSQGWLVTCMILAFFAKAKSTDRFRCRFGFRACKRTSLATWLCGKQMSCEVTVIFPFSVLLACIFIIQLCSRRGIKFTTHVHNGIAIVTFSWNNFHGLWNREKK